MRTLDCRLVGGLPVLVLSLLVAACSGDMPTEADRPPVPSADIIAPNELADPLASLRGVLDDPLVDLLLESLENQDAARDFTDLLLTPPMEGGGSSIAAAEFVDASDGDLVVLTALQLMLDHTGDDGSPVESARDKPSETETH